MRWNESTMKPAYKTKVVGRKTRRGLSLPLLSRRLVYADYLLL